MSSSPSVLSCCHFACLGGLRRGSQRGWPMPVSSSPAAPWSGWPSPSGRRPGQDLHPLPHPTCAGLGLLEFNAEVLGCYWRPTGYLAIRKGRGPSHAGGLHSAGLLLPRDTRMNRSKRQGAPVRTPCSAAPTGWPCREPPNEDGLRPSPPYWVDQPAK